MCSNKNYNSCRVRETVPWNAPGGKSEGTFQSENNHSRGVEVGGLEEYLGNDGNLGSLSKKVLKRDMADKRLIK